MKKKPDKEKSRDKSNPFQIMEAREEISSKHCGMFWMALAETLPDAVDRLYVESAPRLKEYRKCAIKAELLKHSDEKSRNALLYKWESKSQKAFIEYHEAVEKWAASIQLPRDAWSDNGEWFLGLADLFVQLYVDDNNPRLKESRHPDAFPHSSASYFRKVETDEARYIQQAIDGMSTKEIVRFMQDYATRDFMVIRLPDPLAVTSEEAEKIIRDDFNAQLTEFLNNYKWKERIPLDKVQDEHFVWLVQRQCLGMTAAEIINHKKLTTSEQNVTKGQRGAAMLIGLEGLLRHWKGK